VTAGNLSAEQQALRCRLGRLEAADPRAAPGIWFAPQSFKRSTFQTLSRTTGA
jgi:hypothetical protein